MRLSALLLILADSRPSDEALAVVGWTVEQKSDVLDALRRRRLPWDAPAAALAVQLVIDGGFDEQRVGLALHGAEVVCRSGAVDVGLLDALERCATWLESVPATRWRVPQLRLAVRRVLSVAAPPDVLDLSLVRSGDAWGDRALEVARRIPPADVTAFVRQLAGLGDRRPSKAWLAAAEQSLQAPGARELLRAWLELAADTDIVPADGVTTFAGTMLFAPGNEDVVRAAVHATVVVPDGEWVPPVLGVLARRGAATSGAAGMTAPLALKVASAAVAALETRGKAADRRELEDLFEDLSRRDLVRRIGRALGWPDRAAERDTTLRRAKSAAVRRKADPGPALRRAEVDVLIRRHLGPVLREVGFRGSGRTWRRFHLDRVDVIAVGSSEDLIGLEFGCRFNAAHPGDEPYAVARERVLAYHLDVRHVHDLRATPVDLDVCGTYIRSVVVPFLDSMGRYELVVAYIESGAGAPGGESLTSNPGSPAASAMLGMLATEAGDREHAVDHLTRYCTFNESAGVTPSIVEHWRAQLRRARALPPAG